MEEREKKRQAQLELEAQVIINPEGVTKTEEPEPKVEELKIEEPKLPEKDWELITPNKLISLEQIHEKFRSNYYHNLDRLLGDLQSLV